MMKGLLRKAVTTALVGSALASSAASAIDVVDLGAVPATGFLKATGKVPQYAWDGFNSTPPNLGWAHNSKWYTFTLNATTTIDIRAVSTVTGQQFFPAFSVWKTTGGFVGGDHTSHVYNQVGLSGSSKFLKPASKGANGVKKFIGYVNAGTPFTNGDGASVGIGSKGVSGVNPDRTKAALARTLKKGQYLIALGGSCNDQSCGEALPKSFRLVISKLPAF